MPLLSTCECKGLIISFALLCLPSTFLNLWHDSTEEDNTKPLSIATHGKMWKDASERLVLSQTYNALHNSKEDQQIKPFVTLDSRLLFNTTHNKLLVLQPKAKQHSSVYNHLGLVWFFSSTRRKYLVLHLNMQRWNAAEYNHVNVQNVLFVQEPIYNTAGASELLLLKNSCLLQLKNEVDESAETGQLH